MNGSTMPNDEIETRVGRAGFGENYFKGYSIYADLAGRQSVWNLVSTGIDGPPLDAEDVELFDFLATATMVADPRIWLFKVCRLVACYGSPLAAQGAAKMVLEGSFLGPHAAAEVARNLVDVRRELGNDFDQPDRVEAFLRGWFDQRGTFPGFGVVGRKFDERQQHVDQWYEARRDATGEYWTLSRHLMAAAVELRNLRPNAALPVSCILLDMGYDPDQIELISMSFMDVILTTMSHEGAQQKSPSLRKVDRRSVSYAGPAAQTTPRKQAASDA